jgi:hypothetical protein
MIIERSAFHFPHTRVSNFVVQIPIHLSIANNFQVQSNEYNAAIYRAFYDIKPQKTLQKEQPAPSKEKTGRIEQFIKIEKNGIYLINIIREKLIVKSEQRLNTVDRV